MQEKDGWKRVRASVPDYRIIVRAARKARKARKYHNHHKIYIRGAHYEYLFEKVAGMRSIIYRRRLKHRERSFFLKYAIKGLTNRSKLLLTFLVGFIVLLSLPYIVSNETFPTFTEDVQKIINSPVIVWEEYKEEQTEKKKERIKSMEYEVVEIVNSIRKEKGIKQLVWDDQLYQYSKKHSEEMASKRKLFHSSMYEPYAENCWGGEGSTSWDANDIVNSWMSSHNHKTWLLCSNLHHVGVGIVITDTGMYASWTFWRRETSESDWRYT